MLQIDIVSSMKYCDYMSITNSEYSHSDCVLDKVELIYAKALKCQAHTSRHERPECSRHIILRVNGPKNQTHNSRSEWPNKSHINLGVKAPNTHNSRSERP